jgi:hypothetical protein
MSEAQSQLQQQDYTEFGTPIEHAEMMEETETAKRKRKIEEVAKEQAKRESFFNFKDLPMYVFTSAGMAGGSIGMTLSTIFLGSPSILIASGLGLGMGIGNGLFFLKERYYKRKNSS